MKAIILAAGRGSRLREKTDTVPKCMVELWGKPLLIWQMKALREAGIKEIGVVTGYKAERIRQQIKEVRFFHNKDWEQTNMFASLLCANEWLEMESCIVSYSDIIYTKTAVASLLKLKSVIGLTYYTKFFELWKQRLENPLEDLESFQIDNKGKLLEIGHHVQTLDEIQGQYMGLIKFTPDGWKKTKKALQQNPPRPLDQIDMTSVLSHLITKDLAIQTTACDDFWIEVDSLEDLHLYESWKKERYYDLFND